MASCSFKPSADALLGLSLCAGYAGLDLGIGIAEPSYRTVGYVEQNPHAAATLVARMDDKALDPALIWDDLRTFDGRPWRHRVHVVSAGYPCQPFSLAGNRRGTDDPRHLWPQVARIVDEVRPEWVFAENVEGHLDLGFADVRDELNRLGYTAKAGLFSAAEAGASHRRRRLFILAHADSLRRRELGGHRSIRWQDQVCEDHGSRADQRWSDPADERGASLVSTVEVAQRARVAARGVEGIFTPGPDELETWDRLLSVDPHAEPAVLRTPDGVAGRVDRTAGVGNGVCSVAAAVAWAVLRADFDLG